MKKVSFAGAYGIRSIGDDAALLVMVEELRSRLGDLDGVVIARHAGEAGYAPYGLRSVQNIEYDRKSESMGRWFRGFNYEDDRTELGQLYREIATSDLLVLGAGNAILDVTIDLLNGPIPYMALLSLMARMSRTPVMWYGLSVGPVRTGYGRDLTRLIIDLAESVTVRDERSLDEIESFGFPRESATLLPDPVIGAEPPAPGLEAGLLKKEGVPEGLPRVVVSVRDMPPDAGLSIEGFIEVMARVSDRLVKELDALVLFVPQCIYSHGEPFEDDRNVAEAVKERMERKEGAYVVRGEYTVKETLALYRGAAAAVAARLHANVFAAIQGVPVVALSYNPKVMEFMRWLGCPEYALGLDGLSAESIMGALGRRLSDDEKDEEVRRRLMEGRREVGLYADMAMRLLSEGASPAMQR